MAASFLTSVAALVAALREPELPWKPFWALLALVGVGGGAMVSSQPDQVYWYFGIALPTASFTAADGSWQPQVIRLMFPLGAVMVAMRVIIYRSRRQEAQDRH
ncbi:hypothetical protein [Qipengyuania sp. 902]|uniref:hypothetical protein n=1 Tax=Qipengyuania sp. 902 TaxID=3417565 RepID=UPI003EBC967D